MAYEPDGVRAHLITLFEVELGRRLDALAWTQAAHPNLSCWYVAHPEGEPSQVEENGVAMIVAASLADAELTASSWFYDASTGRLCVHISDDDEPDEADPYIQSYHWSRHANEPFEFMGKSYRPDLDVSSMPDVTFETGEYHEDLSAQSFGSIVLFNHKGHYDTLLDLYIWEARRFVIRVGERDKGDSNFETMIDGWTGSIDWSPDKIEIGTEDLQTNLL